MPHPSSRSSVLALALLFATCAPDARAASDTKTIGAAGCLPYGPDTTAAELAYSPTGIYNPGTANEKVLCVLTRDQDAAYAAEQLGLLVHYRVLGGTPSRMTCTLFIGSSSRQEAAVYSLTAAGSVQSGGARGYVVMFGGPQALEVNAAPVNLVCVLPPKTSFANVEYAEFGATQVP